MTPIRSKPPNSEKLPMSDRSGLLDDVVGQRRHLQRPAVRVDLRAVGADPRADVGDRLDDDRQDRRGDDADEQRALDLADDEHGCQQQAEDEDEDRPAGQLPADAEADQRDARAG